MKFVAKIYWKLICVHKIECTHYEKFDDTIHVYNNYPGKEFFKVATFVGKYSIKLVKR